MKRSVVALIAAAMAFAATVLAPGGASADSVFAPSTSVRLCNAMAADFADPTFGGGGAGCPEVLTAGAATSTTVTYSALSGNLNPQTLVTFYPTLGTAGATGDRLAGVRLNTTISLSNGSCITALQLDFVLYKVDTASAPSYPLAAGSVNRFVDWRVGSTAVLGDGGIVAGVDINHAGPASRPLTNIPQYVLDAFSPATPTAVYGGLTNTGVGEWVPLYLVQFAAGGLSTAPGIYSKTTSSMGSPLVWVLGDPTTSQQSAASPSDTCETTNITTTLLGTTNPAAGTRMFLQYVASERDLDQDGFGNAIDTCPFNAAPAEDPRNTLGVNDTDSDGIMNSCDTNLPSAAGADVDSDGFQNRLDNCPQASNGGAAQADASEVSVPGDLGPRTDGIGDACDSEMGVITVIQNGANTTGPNPTAISITMSDSVANGRYMSRSNHIPKCFDAGPEVDADGDGYCGAGAAGIGGESASSDGGAGAACLLPSNSCFVRHNLWSGTHPGAQMDADGDTVTPDSGSPSNWSDVIETYLGTDPTKPCAQNSTANNEGPLDNWPLDMDDNRLVNGTDYQKFGTVLSLANGGGRGINQGGNGDGTLTTAATVTVPGMGTQKQTRFDLNLDGFLSGADMGKFNAYITDGLCDGVGGSLNNVPATLGGTFQQ